MMTKTTTTRRLPQLVALFFWAIIIQCLAVQAATTTKTKTSSSYHHLRRGTTTKDDDDVSLFSRNIAKDDYYSLFSKMIDNNDHHDDDGILLFRALQDANTTTTTTTTTTDDNDVNDDRPPKRDPNAEGAGLGFGIFIGVLFLVPVIVCFTKRMLGETTTTTTMTNTLDDKEANTKRTTTTSLPTTSHVQNPHGYAQALHGARREVDYQARTTTSTTTRTSLYNSSNHKSAPRPGQYKVFFVPRNNGHTQQATISLEFPIDPQSLVGWNIRGHGYIHDAVANHNTATTTTTTCRPQQQQQLEGQGDPEQPTTGTMIAENNAINDHHHNNNNNNNNNHNTFRIIEGRLAPNGQAYWVEEHYYYLQESSSNKNRHLLFSFPYRYSKKTTTTRQLHPARALNRGVFTFESNHNEISNQPPTFQGTWLTQHGMHGKYAHFQWTAADLVEQDDANHASRQYHHHHDHNHHHERHARNDENEKFRNIVTASIFKRERPLHQQQQRPPHHHHHVYDFTGGIRFQQGLHGEGDVIIADLGPLDTSEVSSTELSSCWAHTRLSVGAKVLLINNMRITSSYHAKRIISKAPLHSIVTIVTQVMSTDDQDEDNIASLSSISSFADMFTVTTKKKSGQAPGFSLQLSDSKNGHIVIKAVDDKTCLFVNAADGNTDDEYEFVSKRKQRNLAPGVEIISINNHRHLTSVPATMKLLHDEAGLVTILATIPKSPPVKKASVAISIPIAADDEATEVDMTSSSDNYFL